MEAITFEPRPRFGFTEAAPRVRSQRGKNFVYRLLKVSPPV